MIHKVFTIYDSKAECYMTPFFLPQTAMAVRTFGECVNSPDHQFGKHSQDYTLFEIGLYTDTDASILPHDPRKSLGNGLEFKKSELQPAYEEHINETKIRDDASIQSSSGSGNST